MMLIIDAGWFMLGEVLVLTALNLSLVFYAKSLEMTITKLAKTISTECKILLESKPYGERTDNSQSY